jgi:hypothetical protein
MAATNHLPLPCESPGLVAPPAAAYASQAFIALRAIRW